MATTQQMLSAVNDMQVNAQAALPVIPNNGNPAGANNMPASQQQAPATVAPTGPDLSWLQPSQSMMMFQQGMQQRQQQLDMQRQQMYAPAQGVPQQAAMPTPMQSAALPPTAGLPVMPQFRGQEQQGPVMPNFNAMIPQQAV